MLIATTEPEPDKSPSTLSVIAVTDHSLLGGASSQRDETIQIQQAIQMMELLKTVLKGVEWHEIEEGRADDPEREALLTGQFRS